MRLKTLWFSTLMLASLGMTMGAAHLLELPAKMAYDAQTYTVVNSTLYRQFAYIGGFVQVLAIAGMCWLAYRLRQSSSFGLALGAAVCLVLSLALWYVLVEPVNAEWARLLREAPGSAATAYILLRPRWEYGHAAAFLPWLIGVGLLVRATLRQVPPETLIAAPAGSLSWRSPGTRRQSPSRARTS
jgi:hypothetical protein